MQGRRKCGGQRGFLTAALTGDVFLDEPERRSEMNAGVFRDFRRLALRPNARRCSPKSKITTCCRPRRIDVM